MALSEQTRLNLRRELERLLGPEMADAALEAMPNISYDDIATSTDLTNLRVTLRADLSEVRSELRGEMVDLRGDLRGEMADLRGDLCGEMADLRAEMGNLRGDLSADMATNLKQMLFAHLTSTVAIGGLFLGFG